MPPNLNKDGCIMKSFIGWIGGKRALASKIIAHFPDSYDRYIEVFGGAGWILFKQEVNSKRLEVFNDINSDLINLYRCIKYHATEVQRELMYMLSSREVFINCLNDMNRKSLTDIQKAARYLYIIKLSFGSDRSNFATNRSTIMNVSEYLIKVQERLKYVVVENLDFERLIKTYDRPTALFYLDPTYYKAESYYEASFSEEDHLRLANVLNKIKGKFVLSYNDEPFIRSLYRDYSIYDITRINQLNGGKRSPYREVIIKNY